MEMPEGLKNAMLKLQVAIDEKRLNGHRLDRICLLFLQEVLDDLRTTAEMYEED